MNNHTSRLEKNENLNPNEIKSVISEMLSGHMSDYDIVEFLSKLADRGETDDELLAMLEMMQEFAVKVDGIQDSAIDMCGTGGDRLCTFNISTTASFVAAAAGAIVAKHGNHSSSGMSGSADIFQHLGYRLDQEPSDISHILKKHKIAFMFAQKFHPAMKHVATARKQMAKRTAFNLLGPLSNPASVKNQLVGVSSYDFLERIPKILKETGAHNIMSVYSENGMDEFATCATNHVCLMQNGKTVTFSISAIDVRLHPCIIQDIQIHSKNEAIAAFLGVLNGTASRPMIETVAMNAAGGLVVAGMTKDLKDGTEIALDVIKSGAAFNLLKRFVKDVGKYAKLEVI